MAQLYSLIDRLIELNIESGLIEPSDIIYVRNRVLALFKAYEYEAVVPATTDFYDTLDALALLAIQQGLIDDSSASQDIFTSHLMNLFLDKPSVINSKFWYNYQLSPKLATDCFYSLSKATNYIKVNRIAKNQAFTTQSPYGPIQITINLSKPEKDPKEIARMKSAPPSKYPSCLLCVENEGYEGTLTHPDRANHRMIHLDLNDSNWMLQYSPYLYYNEHCIVLSSQHKPMQITKDTFYNLLDFITLFPHYFIGSNADLPIVGGSILSHEHYQGGRHTFPIDHATEHFTFSITDYPEIEACALNWPLSTIQLRGKNQESLVQCGTMILETWQKYSDEACAINAFTGTIPHNTITPICKRDGEDYLLRLVLRNNRTTDEHPLGIFHPHADVHHIKKENIGLIEVMGLAILPGRLLTEIESVKAFIRSEHSDVASYHLEWAEQLKASYDSTQDLDAFIRQSIGDKFTRVLEDAGVYKLTPEGTEGFKRFVAQFGKVL